MADNRVSYELLLVPVAELVVNQLQDRVDLLADIQVESSSSILLSNPIGLKGLEK